MKGQAKESGSSAVTERVTDEELQSALEEALAAGDEETPAEAEAAPEETPEEVSPPAEPVAAQPQPPPTPEEPTDPRERTALGRKVKGLELEVQRLTQMLSARPQAPPANSPQANEDEPPEFITTPDELERYLSIRERKRQAEVQGYQMGYGQRFLEIGKDDPMYMEVEQEMMSSFNRRETGNPAIDAELNYHRARAAVLSKKLASPAPEVPAAPKIPGKGDKPQGSGVTIASRNSRPASAPPQLDEFAADFIRRTGMKEESVREALGAAKPRR